MSRSRATTPAARRRAGVAAPTRSRARPKPASKPARKAPPKKARKPSPKARTRSAPRRAKPRRAPRTRRTVSRPRPLRALRRAVGSTSWRYRLGILVILAGMLTAGYFLWLRDSSLVAVDNVDVVGVTAGDRERIVSELTRVAEQQTTLHADPAKIAHAAAAFPTVASVDVDPNFPHGMRIEVTERPPALLVESGGDTVPAAADGTLLAGVEVPEDEAKNLPVLELHQLPGGRALQGEDLQRGLILGAAPPPLRPLIEGIEFDKDHGVEVTMTGDIGIHFGSGARAAQKWAAASAVLADPKTNVLCYVDVRVPERAAAGCAA